MLRISAGQRVVVMGLGRFGGGAGVARWLVRAGADVLVTDLAAADALRESIAQIRDLIDSGRVALRLGAHEFDDFRRADVVVTNPAVKKPWANEYLAAAAQAGVPITTEIRLLVERLDRGRVIGVTGSAGKSTTAAMIHHILARLGTPTHLGGNIGGSLLLSIPTDANERPQQTSSRDSGIAIRDSGIGNANAESRIANPDWIVLELSSAMLHWLGEGAGFIAAEGWSPHIAVLTNLQPNHLDWHGTFEHYRQSKMNIRRWQKEGDCFIEGPDAPRSHDAIELSIPGQHNQANARIACRAAGAAVGLSVDRLAALLRDFRGLPHRLELVASFDGLRFYNDSKSTTPQATRLSIDAFDESTRIHLIAGGSDKGVDLSPLGELADRVAGLYAIGATGRAIVASAPRSSRAQFCATLEIAVDCALSRMQRGDVLLLSPGCASFDQYANFEERGRAFVSLIHRRIHQPAGA